MNEFVVRSFVICVLSVLANLVGVVDCGSAVDLTHGKTKSRPIEALLITGGCCHDYDRQKLIIPRGVSARADVRWTVVHQGGTTTDSKIPFYNDPNWAEGFDVVVHNECFSDVKDQAWVDNILKPHRNGLPAVLLHCAMHCYRTGSDDWFEFCGVQSPGHGPHYPFTMDNANPAHPVMRGFGESWGTPNEELYYSVKVWPTVQVLSTAKRRDNQEPQVVAWTNQYQNKTRVFATTVGHYNATMAEPKYLDMLTQGILWAVHGENAPSIRPTDDAKNAEIRALALVQPSAQGKDSETPSDCCGDGNLLRGKKAFASSEETDKQNFAAKAIDGKLSTRWCASSGNPNEWLKVDLGKEESIGSVRLHWEQENNAYRYRIDYSTDDSEWKNLIDRSTNRKKDRICEHEHDAVRARFLRVSFLGSKSGGWGSLFEWEAYPGKLPALPESAKQMVSPAASVADVKGPAGFDVKMFASPPVVTYPVCLTASVNGEVFVGVDEQGSLGKKPGGGRILRCLDTDGDGTADRVNVFAEIDHPRGLIYDQGNLWVLHPPMLSLYTDRDLDGVADESRTLITGISTSQVEQRGADHTTNGIRMGIDGWIYIAVGDFGFHEAKGTDGRVLSRRGGGIVRVRPDGTDMEIYAWGLRNILDVAIDPYLDMFTRDNTNDGGGWNVRFNHILQGADYGYPSLYLNFSDEIMPTLADYGGGSGCGSMYLHDTRWPEDYSSVALTCDWGTSKVYRHRLITNGVTFDPHQADFLDIPRPTDIDVDGSGRLYVSSWKNGSFSFSDHNVGFVAQVTPQGFIAKPFPHLSELDDEKVIDWLTKGIAVPSLHAQRELLRRGTSRERIDRLKSVAMDVNVTLAGRVAAIFTIKQLLGGKSTDLLLEIGKRDAAVKPFIIRAIADRIPECQESMTEYVLEALGDLNPKVQSQALIALSRLGQAHCIKDMDRVAKSVLPWTRLHSVTDSAEKAKANHTLPDPSRVLPHLAVNALVSMQAYETCLGALDSSYREGAFWALRKMHDPKVVSGLIQRLYRPTDSTTQTQLVESLARLYYREGEYTKGDWWGTRPDTSGPYYDRQKWEQTTRIEKVLGGLAQGASPELTRMLGEQMKRHHISLQGDRSTRGAGNEEKPISVAAVDPSNPNQIGNQPFADVFEKARVVMGDSEKGKILFTSQNCIACHTYEDGQTPKGPHLADIGKRYSKPELLESILRPSAKLAQGFESWQFLMDDGTTYVGFVVLESAESVTIRQSNGVAAELLRPDLEDRKKQETSMMPEGLVSNLTVEQLADLVAYLQSL